MLGRIILCTILAAGIVGGVAWYTGRLPQIIEQPAASQEVGKQRESVPSRSARENVLPTSRPLDRQVALAAPAAAAAVQQAPRAEEPNMTASELIVVSDGRLALVKKQEVPAQQDGVLAWIGIALEDGEVLASDEKVWNVDVRVGDQ